MQKLLTLSLLTAKALAQDATESESIEERKFSHIVKMAYTQIQGQTTHSLKVVSKMMQNYGCHCFPGNTRAAGGQGPAVDDYDQLCKNLFRCHKCIEHDYPGQIDVNLGKYRWSNNADNSLNCDGNTEQVKKDLCECDAGYAMELASVWDDSTYDYSKWNAKKNTQYTFVPEAVCIAEVAGGEMECCGTVPNRYPYNSEVRSCCENTKTYSSTYEECCSDGTVAAPGSC